MEDQSSTNTYTIGNTEGDHNVIINTITFKLEPSSVIPDNLVFSLNDRLAGLERKSSCDWSSALVVLTFSAYCMLLLCFPIWLVIKGYAISDVQSLILSVSCAFSGITGLLGVMLGEKVKRVKGSLKIG